MQKVTGRDTVRPGEVRVPVWGWLSLGVLLFVLFAVLYDNGVLLAPLVGENAYANNYLHEFFHDARHLLGVPGH